MLDVTGGVAEVGPVLPAGHVRDPPDRLAGNRHHEIAASDAAELAERRRRVRHVLQHLDREDQIERRVAERQRLDVGEARGEPLRAPVLGQRGIRQVDSGDERVGEPAGDAVGHLALAHADLEDPRRRTRGQRFVKPGEERAHEAALDRVRAGVLVVRVPGRDRVLACSQ